MDKPKPTQNDASGFVRALLAMDKTLDLMTAAFKYSFVGQSDLEAYHAGQLDGRLHRAHQALFDVRNQLSVQFSIDVNTGTPWSKK